MQNIIYATEQEARTYILPSSSQMIFMDPANPIFYVKSTDAFGISTFEIADFKLRPQETTESNSKYITHEDLKAFKDELLSAISSKTQEDIKNG